MSRESQVGYEEERRRREEEKKRVREGRRDASCGWLMVGWLAEQSMYQPVVGVGEAAAAAAPIALARTTLVDEPCCKSSVAQVVISGAWQSCRELKQEPVGRP